MNKFIIAAAITFLATASMAGSVADAQDAYQAGQYDAALKIAIPAAKAGDPYAQNIVGAAYNDGNGVNKDIAASIEWFEKSAAQGYVKAYYNLGMTYLYDLPAPDYDKAISNFESAMEQDYSFAYLQRAKMYFKGLGGVKNPDMAAKLRYKVRALGDAEAISTMGDMYRVGVGAELDLEMARELYAEAAQMGDAASVGNLALMYANGMGGPKDLVAAHALLVEAEEMGDANSDINLAGFIMRRDGYWHDPAMAFAYCLWGIKTGGGDQAPQTYKDTCEMVKSELTEDQLAQGVATFKSWQ